MILSDLSRVLLYTLLASTFLLTSGSSLAADAEAEIAYIGESRCKTCHNVAETGLFHSDWAATPHARAIFVLSEQERADPLCLSCHTTGYGKPGGFVSMAETPKLANVQCESCHGPGAEHLASARRNLRNPSAAVPPPGKPNELNCRGCHNERSPTWKEDRYIAPNGKKSGFNYEMAFARAAHVEVFRAVGLGDPDPYNPRVRRPCGE